MHAYRDNPPRYARATQPPIECPTKQIPSNPLSPLFFFCWDNDKISFRPTSIESKYQSKVLCTSSVASKKLVVGNCFDTLIQSLRESGTTLDKSLSTAILLVVVVVGPLLVESESLSATSSMISM
jgi:hypothetical protein